jgi:hypothetical protein
MPFLSQKAYSLIIKRFYSYFNNLKIFNPTTIQYENETRLYCSS